MTLRQIVDRLQELDRQWSENEIESEMYAAECTALHHKLRNFICLAEEGE